MVEWRKSAGNVPYETAVRFMGERVEAILQGHADELVWLLEHPPVYTAGTSTDISEQYFGDDRIPVLPSRRGGAMTYHGPGQRVVYVLLDLNRRGKDVRRFVWCLEEWVIRALAEFGVTGERRCGRVGVWVVRTEKPALSDGLFREDKLAAIGVRLRRWVSSHGLSLNVDPNLAHYDGIAPCGITDHGVTSLTDLGLPVTIPDVDAALQHTFNAVFGCRITGTPEG